MKLRNIITGIILILVIGLQAQPQQKQGQRQGPPPVPNDEQVEKMVEELGEKLELNETQQLTLLNLHKEHFAQVRLKQAEFKEQHKANRSEMEKMREDFESKVKAELTEEQALAFDEIRQERRPKGEKRK